MHGRCFLAVEDLEKVIDKQRLYKQQETFKLFGLKDRMIKVTLKLAK
jgi:hypothetical protein